MRLLKKNYRILVVFGIPIILIIIILIFYKYKPLKRESIPVTKSISNIQKKETIIKVISEVNNLIEIPDKSKARVYEIIDVKSVQAKSPIFRKAYPHDLVILLPDKTIIFDTLTKTVRDVSSEVFYDKFAD